MRLRHPAVQPRGAPIGNHQGKATSLRVLLCLVVAALGAAVWRGSALHAEPQPHRVRGYHPRHRRTTPMQRALLRSTRWNQLPTRNLVPGRLPRPARTP